MTDWTLSIWTLISKLKVSSKVPAVYISVYQPNKPGPALLSSLPHESDVSATIGDRPFIPPGTDGCERRKCEISYPHLLCYCLFSPVPACAFRNAALQWPQY